MATKAENIKPRTVKVYDLDEFEKLMNGLKIATCMISESHNVVDEKSVMKRLSALTLNGPSDGNACSACGIGPFESRAQQTAHYKHHWHTHNLKRKLFGKQPLSLGQFNSRLDDDDSVSGSDSDGESNENTPSSDLFAAATRHCKAFFTNKAGQVMCIYRCILHHKKEELSTDGEGVAWVSRCKGLAVPGAQRWAVVMVSGGHFAGAVFSGGAAVVHKTFHSYTSRRGQGAAQATRDSRGNSPRSAGASLRRYNQAKFLEHVQEIISGWAEDLLGCSLILYRAVGSMNQAAIFGKNSPLNKDDPRLRVLPFPTRKPTYKEVQRVHETIASLEVYDTMELFQKALISSIAKPATKSGSDTSIEPKKKPVKISPAGKPIDRAKSRERTPRELPTSQMSSEDEGPCYIDCETPKDWTKTLYQQASSGNITNSRKNLISEINDCSVASSVCSETDEEEKKQALISEVKKKKENKKKEDEREKQKQDKKLMPPPAPPKVPLMPPPAPPKVPANIKKLWKAISSKEESSLETILERYEGDVEAACNLPDPADGNTALHKAAIAAQPDMVTSLLKAGGDPCLKNHLLQTPYAASPHADTRLAFRLFQAQFPDKYNYAKSQIPGPLTPELLEQEKEKKAQQKRAKRQREKEKQAEKIKTNKFLQLTDEQKVNADEKRCFLCGGALPKAPFEYNKYQFCSVKCLQNHRNLRPLNMSV